MFKIIIVTLAITQFATALNQSETANDFGKSLQRLSESKNSTEKLVKFRALVDVLKEDDPAYSQKILKLTFALRNDMNDARKRNDQKLLGDLENLKGYLPRSFQNLTCSKVKFYNTYFKTYLYADLKILRDTQKRYAFADGNYNDYTTTWRYRDRGDYVYIDNDVLDECLLSHDRTAFTWIPALFTCGTNALFAIEPVRAKEIVRLRNNHFNQYLQVSDKFINGKRILVTEPSSDTSYWEIHCANYK